MGSRSQAPYLFNNTKQSGNVQCTKSIEYIGNIHSRKSMSYDKRAIHNQFSLTSSCQMNGACFLAKISNKRWEVELQLTLPTHVYVRLVRAPSSVGREPVSWFSVNALCVDTHNTSKGYQKWKLSALYWRHPVMMIPATKRTLRQQTRFICAAITVKQYV